MNYKNAALKIRIETILIFPIVALGKIYGRLFPLKTRHNIFLIYSNADTGGAAVCNADILQAVINENPIVIFAKKPKNNKLLNLYLDKKGATILDLSSKIDNKLFHFVNVFYRGVISSWINAQKPAVVFGGEAIYFYKLVPFIKKDILKVELSHLDSWLHYNIGFIDKIDKRIYSTAFLKQQVAEQYKENNLSGKYFDKLYFLDNAINIPEYKIIENEILQVYFIGRGVAQKRVHLIAAIAKVINERKLPIKINFVGDVEKVIDIAQYPFCNFYGTISDVTKLNEVYCNADVLLLSSLYEGLPMVVIAMMAYGKIIVSTAVNGIPDYIEHTKNGFLIYEKEENDIINKSVEYLELLCSNKELKNTIGYNNRQKAETLFSIEQFNKNYRNIFGLQ